MCTSCTSRTSKKRDATSRPDSSSAYGCCSARQTDRDPDVLELITQATIVILALAVLMAFVRIVRGPTLPDRIVAMDLLGVLVVGLIVVLAASSGVRATLDAAIVIALIGFLGTVAYATYVERGDPQ